MINLLSLLHLVAAAATALAAPAPSIQNGATDSHPVSDRGPAQAVVRRLALMGTVIEIDIEAESRAAALAASEDAVRALEATEARLSTWREDSELGRLNRAPVGEPVPLSSELAKELAVVHTWWQETGGAFDPGIGALIAAWGLRQGGRLPGEAERRSAAENGGLRFLDLEGSTAVRRRAGLRIEEGGFGKGAGLDQAIQVLRGREVRRAVLDLGGQVAVLGEGPFEIAVADPRHRDRNALSLSIDSGSLSTSGNSERSMSVGGVKVGHILDPRRGEPAADFGSVTVWAADALTADCLSTGLFVLGPDSALDWARGRPGIEVLVIEVLNSGLRARATPGLAGRATALSGDLDIEVGG